VKLSEGARDFEGCIFNSFSFHDLDPIPFVPLLLRHLVSLPFILISVPVFATYFQDCSSRSDTFDTYLFPRLRRVFCFSRLKCTLNRTRKLYKRASELSPLTLCSRNRSRLPQVLKVSQVSLLSILLKILSYRPLSHLDPLTWDFYAFFFLLPSLFPFPSLLLHLSLFLTLSELTSRESFPLSVPLPLPQPNPYPHRGWGNPQIYVRYQKKPSPLGRGMLGAQPRRRKSSQRFAVTRHMTRDTDTKDFPRSTLSRIYYLLIA
jgi:hypothetical protein